VFVKEPVTLKIASILVMLSLSLMAGPYLGFFTVGAQLNSTEVTNNQMIIPQSESNPITPFTIPRGESSESNGLQSSSTNGSSNNTLTQPPNDLVLLSQKYNDERFGDEIVGEILNNGTIAAEFAKVTVSFYDENSAILGSESTYADPSTISPGQRAAFTIFITSDAIEDDTETYEFTLQWQDSDSNDYSKRITGEPTQTNDNDDGSNTNDDNGINNRIGAIGGDLDCSDISARNFQVGNSDPNNFDADNDGIGCESGNNSNDDNGLNAVSSDNNSRCPDGFHRSPSGDCERVTDTSGMERCPDGYHRSPDGDCERVNNNNDNNNDNNNNDDDGGNNDNDENNNDDNVMDDVEDTVRESGIDSDL
jgi:hypothetical protein